jgi:mannan endo-1,4-beta-mannosidase
MDLLGGKVLVPALAVTLTVLLSLSTGGARADGTGEGSGETGTRTVARASLADRVAIGAYVDGMQEEPGRLEDFERMVGARADIASYYYGFGDVFPGEAEQVLSDGGRRTILLSWDMGPTRFTEWTSGRHNGYLDQIARAARGYAHPVYVRPWPEMNGDWQSFQPTRQGNRRHGGTYREFKRAWRYVVTYLRGQGASNLRWVFNPTADTYAGTTPVHRIWPGTRYVDVLGLDGFNWGVDRSWGRWRSFPSIFRAQYRNLTALHPRAPVWICEVGSKEPRVSDGSPVDTTHDKAAWVRQMFAHTGLRRIKALIWFHAKKERDWRVNSSTGVLNAFRSTIGPG